MCDGPDTARHDPESLRRASLRSAERSQWVAGEYMKKAISFLKAMDFKSLLWVALAFGLTSAVYLAWLDHLVLLVGQAADSLSLVAGYLFQAAGLFIACVFFKHIHASRDDSSADGQGKAAAIHRQALALTVVVFAVVTVPALLTDSAPAVIAFGFLMNLLCGVIAGFYLWVICVKVAAPKRSMVFGGSYAIATVGVGLLAIAHLMRGWTAVPVCVVLAAILTGATLRFDCVGLPAEHALALVGKEECPEPNPTPASQEWKETDLLPLACVAVVLISIVKNLGFNFSSADIQAGLIPEIARIPYAVGLLAAGYINDRSRKNGLICTVAALVIPFMMLGLIHEPISSTVFWGLNYIFFAFFSVFRVVIIMDIVSPMDKAAAPRWHLAPIGLMAGRIGDAVGSGIGQALAGHQVPLIVATGLLFIPAVFILYRLYERCFMPEVVQQRNEKEIFNLFCVHNDLSSREREVLEMLLAGRTNAEIGEALFISENTVKYHVKNILQKTGCKNRVDLQGKYMQAMYHTDAKILPLHAPRERVGD